MKKLIIVALFLGLLPLAINASEYKTYSDTTLSLVSIDTPASVKYVSDITLICSAAAYVDFYDTATNSSIAVPPFSVPILHMFVKTEDVNKPIRLTYDAGSYLNFTKGVQITSSGKILFLSINARSQNGASGSDTRVVDTATSDSPWIAVKGNGYISDITASCSVATYITIYDAVNGTLGTTSTLLFRGYVGNFGDSTTLSTIDRMIHWQYPSGSYIPFSYGLHTVFSSDLLAGTAVKVRYFRINVRDTNGAN